MGEALSKYFRNPDNSLGAQIIFAIAFGLLLSPYSFGLVTYLAFVVVYEALYYAATKGDPAYYGDFYSRLVVNMFGITAFIVGRILVGLPIIVSV